MNILAWFQAKDREELLKRIEYLEALVGVANEVNNDLRGQNERLHAEFRKSDLKVFDLENESKELRKLVAAWKVEWEAAQQEIQVWEKAARLVGWKGES